jgi:hypothetical protein
MIDYHAKGNLKGRIGLVFTKQFLYLPFITQRVKELVAHITAIVECTHRGAFFILSHP